MKSADKVGGSKKGHKHADIIHECNGHLGMFS